MKRLTVGEEYLADHFPGFPVMPGVMMLQCLVEAASWLIRLTDEYRHSVTMLREVKSIKYGNFLRPGQTMDVNVEWISHVPGAVVLKGRGENQSSQTVAAQFTVARYNLADRNPSMKAQDERLIRHWREMFELISGRVAS
jgi:3-hydroxyacyl-[acyl-carrier-protein] dehydratase